jgi:hypothetical protein
VKMSEGPTVVPWRGGASLGCGVRSAPVVIATGDSLSPASSLDSSSGLHR